MHYAGYNTSRYKMMSDIFYKYIWVSQIKNAKNAMIFNCYGGF